MISEATPKTCAECFERQQTANPDTEPSCTLIDELAPISQGITDRNRGAKGVAFDE